MCVQGEVVAHNNFWGMLHSTIEGFNVVPSPTSISSAQPKRQNDVKFQVKVASLNDLDHHDEIEKGRHDSDNQRISPLPLGPWSLKMSCGWICSDMVNQHQHLFSWFPRARKGPGRNTNASQAMIENIRRKSKKKAQL